MKPLKIKSIAEVHRMFGLPAPAHPLISVLDYTDMTVNVGTEELIVILDFYYITNNKGCKNKQYYGQQTYDFDEGVMGFVAPNQILGNGSPTLDNLSGWILLIHPDLLWGTPLAKKIKEYEFFGYTVNEALFVSDREDAVINGIVDNIKTEYNSNIDKFSKQIIITHLENLLSYAERFYNRQFITREKSNHQIVGRLEKLLTDYFNNTDLVTMGLPTVQYISDELNISPNYLRGLLKSLTGLSTQQHIHEKLIDKAKERLSTTNFSVSEIAYELGFEHPQSFSKLFKAKTKLSPLEFRQSFN